VKTRASIFTKKWGGTAASKKVLLHPKVPEETLGGEGITRGSGVGGESEKYIACYQKEKIPA